jgi:CMP-N,N'-diacetyllegionaminic acid synthase
MYKDKKILAVIPARSGSKGLPGKNIIPLSGKPLIAWSVDVAKKSKYIDKILLSTDCPEIASVGEKYGASVPFIRPAELAKDDSSSIDVLIHAVSSLKETYDYLVLLEPTSPLRDVNDIDVALETLIFNAKKVSSIVSVSRVESTHPAFNMRVKSDGLLEPYLSSDFKAPRRQEIEDLYFLDGTIYISNVDDLLLKKSFYHDKTMAYLVPKWKSFEIDDEIDMICCEALIKNRGKYEN